MEIYSKETIDVKNNFQTDSNKSAERRAVSILYADIVSSTKIITSLDPEEITDFIDPAINKMIRAVHKFGGKVMKYRVMVLKLFLERLQAKSIMHYGQRMQGKKF